MSASLSLDFDNKWAYLRAAGRQNWESANSYLPMVSERIIDVLDEFDLPLSVFVVGRDFQHDEDVQAMRSFERLSSCEFGNHSLNHLPWMHTMDPGEIRTEVTTTHQLIDGSLGQRAVGFRGPGFSCPDEVLGVLAELDYVYDASIFPTSMAPIARAVFLMRTQLKGEQKQKAKQLYGGFSALRNPNRPFRRNVGQQAPNQDHSDQRSLWEIPVTVMPLTRFPIHLSYFTFLASFSPWAAKSYFRTALKLCQWTGTPPSLLLHPPDFMGHEDDADMAYFPGMKMSRDEKLSIVRWALALYAKTFNVSTLFQQVCDLDPVANDRVNAKRPVAIPVPSTP